jgi:hypothetical protein
VSGPVPIALAVLVDKTALVLMIAPADPAVEKQAVASLVAAIRRGLDLIVLERTGWEPNALVETCGPIGSDPSWIDQAGVAIRSANPGPTDHLRIDPVGIDPARIGPAVTNVLKQIALGVLGGPIESSHGMTAREIELTTGNSGEIVQALTALAVNQVQAAQVQIVRAWIVRAVRHAPK